MGLKRRYVNDEFDVWMQDSMLRYAKKNGKYPTMNEFTRELARKLRKMRLY